MKNQKEIWSLFRLSDRKQFDNVNLETIEFFYRALDEKNRVDWLMWREGFSGWRPFFELALILTHLAKEPAQSPVPPPVPESVLRYADELSGVKNLPDNETPNTVSNRVIEAATSTLRLTNNYQQKTPLPAREPGKVLSLDDESALSLALESQAASDDRDNVRYNKVFKVRIFAPKGVISALTIDCSTSGFRLKDPLPSGLPRFFHVELDLGTEGKIPLVCSEVPEKDGRRGTRIRIQVNDHFNILKSALFRAA